MPPSWQALPRVTGPALTQSVPGQTQHALMLRLVQVSDLTWATILGSRRAQGADLLVLVSG